MQEAPHASLAAASSLGPHRWWQGGVIYQVYPRSFQDVDGDGIGDLEGIRRRLDYLVDLGVDIVWISPFFPSPLRDFGYDITDYTGIDPCYGTMEDFDRLLAEVHARGMKLLLDLVPNHTSDEHPWFVESRSSRGNPKRDWYIWRDGKPGGGPPSNWRAVSGGSAWEYDDTTGQYYYHAYLKEQPDLNWRNPEVRRAVAEVMRFWLDKGVDGFRVDVIWHLIKDAELRDNPPRRDYRPDRAPYYELDPVYTTDQPEVHEVIQELRDVLDAYEDRMMVGEIYLPVERLVTYYGQGGRSGVHLPFNFQLIQTPWHAKAIGDVVRAYEAALPPHGWPNWVLGNHDRPRLASRIGPDQARAAAMLLLTLRGTPTLYYGDELGMTNIPIPPEQVHDPWEKNMPGIGVGRDPVRTPMRWSGGLNAGFTTGRPWLPVGDDYRERNVEALSRDPKSILALYRRLLTLRRDEPALSLGGYAGIWTQGNVLAYIREWPHEERRDFLVALNLGDAPQEYALPPGLRGRVVLSSTLEREGAPVAERVHLRGGEGLLIALD